MRILLDESLPKRLKNDLAGHDVSTVPEMRWAGKTNGELLALAADRFDVFVTIDQGLRFQQDLTNIAISIIVLRASSNAYPDLVSLVPKLLSRLDKVAPGEISLVTENTKS